jgi:hypothetical protein
MNLGSKFSPKLRKALLREPGDTVIRGLVEIAPGTDADALTRELTSIGAEVRSRSEQARLITVDIPLSRLQMLDALSSVLYVEADERYRP